MSSTVPHGGEAEGLLKNENARLETLLDLQRAFIGAVKLDGSLRPEAIKALFERYQVDIRTFAQLLGVSDSYVHAVIAGRKTDHRIQDAISDRFGIAPDRMWGRASEGAA